MKTYFHRLYFLLAKPVSSDIIKDMMAMIDIKAQPLAFTFKAQILSYFIMPIILSLICTFIFWAYCCCSCKHWQKEQKLRPEKPLKVQKVRMPLYFNQIAVLVQVILGGAAILFIGTLDSWFLRKADPMLNPIQKTPQRIKTAMDTFGITSFNGVANLSDIIQFPENRTENLETASKKLKGINDLQNVLQKSFSIIQGFSKSLCDSPGGVECDINTEAEKIAHFLNVIIELQKASLTNIDVQNIISEKELNKFVKAINNIESSSFTANKVNDYSQQIFASFTEYFNSLQDTHSFRVLFNTFVNNKVYLNIYYSLCDNESANSMGDPDSFPETCAVLKQCKIDNNETCYFNDKLLADKGIDIAAFILPILEYIGLMQDSTTKIASLQGKTSVKDIIKIFGEFVNSPEQQPATTDVEYYIKMALDILTALGSFFIIGAVLNFSLKTWCVYKGHHCAANRSYCCRNSCHACSCIFLLIYTVIALAISVGAGVISQLDNPDEIIRLASAGISIAIPSQIFEADLGTGMDLGFLKINMKPEKIIIDFSKPTAKEIFNTKLELDIEFNFCGTPTLLTKIEIDLSKIDLSILTDSQKDTSLLNLFDAQKSFANVFSRDNNKVIFEDVVTKLLLNDFNLASIIMSQMTKVENLLDASKGEAATNLSITVDTAADNKIAANGSLTNLKAALDKVVTPAGPTKIQPFMDALIGKTAGTGCYQSLSDMVNKFQKQNLATGGTIEQQIKDASTTTLLNTITPLFQGFFNTIYDFVGSDEPILTSQLFSGGIDTLTTVLTNAIDLICIAWAIGIIINLTFQLVLYHFYPAANATMNESPFRFCVCCFCCCGKKLNQKSKLIDKNISIVQNEQPYVMQQSANITNNVNQPQQSTNKGQINSIQTPNGLQLKPLSVNVIKSPLSNKILITSQTLVQDTQTLSQKNCKLHHLFNNHKL